MSKLFIAIPVSNRAAIVEACLPTIESTLYDADSGVSLHGDILAIYDDASTDKASLHLWADELHTYEKNIGIEGQRRIHFMDFWNQRKRHGCTHLYLTDSDAIHDPNWRAEALRLQEKYGGAPICLYNTQAHVRIAGNTIADDPAEEVIWRRSAPGISYLLTLEHVEQVVKRLPGLPPHWNWDWTVPAILGHRMAVSRVNYCDHIGWGGYHHPVKEGFDGGDRCLNPTPWLIAKRIEIVEKLKACLTPS